MERLLWRHSSSFSREICFLGGLTCCVHKCAKEFTRRIAEGLVTGSPLITYADAKRDFNDSCSAFEEFLLCVFFVVSSGA